MELFDGNVWNGSKGEVASSTTATVGVLVSPLIVVWINDGVTVVLVVLVVVLVVVNELLICIILQYLQVCLFHDLFNICLQDFQFTKI